jgi:hypothetical protein
MAAKDVIEFKIANFSRAMWHHCFYGAIAAYICLSASYDKPNAHSISCHSVNQDVGDLLNPILDLAYSARVGQTCRTKHRAR